MKNGTEGGQIRGPPSLKTESSPISLSSPRQTRWGVSAPQLTLGTLFRLKSALGQRLPPSPQYCLWSFHLGGKWVKNGVRGSKKRDINVTMERGYHIISGTNPLRVHRSSSAVFYPFFVEFFIWFFVFYFLIWFYWFFPLIITIHQIDDSWPVLDRNY